MVETKNSSLLNMAKKLPTPVWADVGEEVYPPSEDSFLLLDALESELDRIEGLAPLVVVEVGSGSGVVVTALAGTLSHPSHFIALDINPKATLTTTLTSHLNNVKVEAIVSDLCTCFVQKGLVDLLIFNPPYVVTPPEEIKGTITRAWAGGLKGREVTNRLLEKLPQLMSPKCLGYIVAIEENNPEEMLRTLMEKGFSAETIITRRVPGENLFVIRFQRNPPVL